MRFPSWLVRVKRFLFDPPPPLPDPSDEIIQSLKGEVLYLREMLAERDQKLLALIDARAFALLWPWSRSKGDEATGARPREPIDVYLERSEPYVPKKTREQIEKEFQEVEKEKES